MPRKTSLSAAEARRILLAAQGFGPWRAASRADGGSPAGRARIVAAVDRLGLVQVDSVNVLTRAHYLPLFSRLGAYDRALLDDAAARPTRRLFEYWGHEASLLPVATQPLLRWRMAQEHPWQVVAQTMRTHERLIPPLLAAIAEFGPLTATELEQHLEHDEPRPTGEWGWNWSIVKRLVEALFWRGDISAAGRDRGFRRRYDLAERVLPAEVLRTPTPDRREAIAGLVAIAARALGVATAADLRDYFRLSAADTTLAIADLTEAGELEPVVVPGWPPAWRHRQARMPRRVEAHALLVPFDPLIWQRERVERVFGMRYRIEIYTPAAKRVFGYYVLPFLDGERLSARVDLRADRKAGALVVAGAWSHPEHSAPDAAALATQLWRLAGWLGLTDVAVGETGDLAAALQAGVAGHS